MSVKFERKLPLILFFVFLLLTAIGFIFYQNTVSVQSAIAWEKHTQEVLLRLDETLTLSLDVSTATSNFVIVGNDTYLDPYYRAKPRITQNIAMLRNLMKENAVQQAEIDNLEILLKGYVDEATRKVDLRKSEGYEIAIVELPLRKGKDLMDGIRQSVDRLKKEETRSLQEREQALDKSLKRTIWIFIIGSLAGLVSLAVVNLVVFLEIRRRHSAEKALTEVNLGLEKRINERTRELQEANENLHLIGGDREILLIKEKKAREEAEIATRLRDEFMATVSHELRTPLNSILGWARLMKGGTLDKEQSAKAVGTIIKNSETQNRLIEDLLDVARIISGNLELHMEEIDPAEIVTHSIESVRPAADLKHIGIDIDLPDSLHTQIIGGDRERLLQIFSNLLTNAVKFSPERAKIAVQAVSKDGFVEFIIRDTGIGISREFLPVVFERFRQARSISTKNGGLGLGLAIVRNLAEMHGGSVSAYSAGENTGSEFTVRLPLYNHENLPAENVVRHSEQVFHDNVG